MIYEALKYLVELGRQGSPDIVTSADGTEYWRSDRKVVNDFAPKVASLSTLQGLVDFIKSEDMHNKQIFVKSPTHVYMIDKPAIKTLCRYSLASVECSSSKFGFGNYMKPYIFIEELQKYLCFDANDKTAENAKIVLKVVGNLQSESVHTDHDDGITQKVVVSQGARSAGYIGFKNPVALRFYDTFPDLGAGHPRICNLKFRSSEGNAPMVGLFLAGDPMYEMASRFRIQDWLKERCKNPIII